jgi:hypothetical protein
MELIEEVYTGFEWLCLEGKKKTKMMKKEKQLYNPLE